MPIDRRQRGALSGSLAWGAALAAALAAPGGARAEDDWSVRWSNGLEIESPDKSVQIQIGGSVQLDAAVEDFDRTAERDVPVEDSSGVFFRRARIATEGTLYEDIFFKAEYDFAGGETTFKDVYLGVQNLPFGSKLTVGHFKEPFSLEELSSGLYVTMLERSLADTFAPSRNTGFMLNGVLLDQAMTWQFGGFRETGDSGDDFDPQDTWNLTTRLSFVPWAEEKDSRLVHLGASYSHKFTDPDEPLLYSARPGIDNGDDFVDTGDFQADNVDLFGAEGAILLGPFSLQSEFIYDHVDRPTGSPGDVGFWGAYGEVSWFLTGEHRSYERETGTFGRVYPTTRFSIQNGDCGAWQVAFRYDYIDLEEKDLHGGQLYDLTTTLNWYPTQNTRVIASYIHGHRTGDGNANTGGLRFQVDF